MILPRQYYGGCYGDCDSHWDEWGRWILAGVLIFIGIVALLLVLFLNHRRRGGGGPRFHPRIGMGNRRTNQTQQPLPPQTEPAAFAYGGGAGGGGMYNQNEGYPQYAPPTEPPPQYTGSNADYYGQTPEVTQPGNTYQPPHVK